MTLHVLVDGRTIQDQWDGIGRLTYQWLEALADRPGLRLSLLTTNGRDARLSATTLPSGITRIPFPFEPTSVAAHAAWPRIVRRVKPDLVFVPYHLSAPIYAGAPVVVGVMDCIFEADPTFAPNRASRIGYMTATRLVAARSSSIVTISALSKEHFLNAYPSSADRIHVVRLAADDRYGRLATDSDAARVHSELGLPERYVLNVGARRPHKNLQLLLEAFARIEPERRGIGLVLVGSADPKFKDSVPELVRNLGLEEWVVALSGVPERDMSAVYQGASLLAHPSILEGYGFPPAEAMMAGIPVVASSGVPSVTELDSPLGPIILPPRGPAQWAEAMTDLLDNDEYSSQRGSAGARAIRQHSWNDSADELEHVLRATAGR